MQDRKRDLCTGREQTLKLPSLHETFISGKTGSSLQDPKTVCFPKHLVCFTIVLSDTLRHLPAMYPLTLKDKRIAIGF